MIPGLQGYADAVLGAAGPAELPELADDLRAVAALVDGNEELFIALTDTAVSAVNRRGIVSDLLDGRVAEPARRAAAYAAGAVGAPEVPASLDWLAHTASRRADGVAADPEVLGRLGARQRVGGFAAAVFEDLSTEQLEETEDELFRFARTVEATPPLRDALSNRDLPVDVRQGVVSDLLQGKVSAATLRLVDYTVGAGRSRDLVGTLDWLVERTAEARGWRVARVRSARPIDDEQRSRLSESLTQLTGVPVELQVTLEPSLLGGVVVEVGNIQIDASAEGRLESFGSTWLLAVGTTGWPPTAPGQEALQGLQGRTQAQEEKADG